MAEQSSDGQGSTERSAGRHAAPDDGPEAATTSTEAPTQQAEAPTQKVTSSQEEPPTAHVSSQTREAEPTRQMERPGGPPPASVSPAERGEGARRAVRRVTGVVATLLRVVGLILALVLVAWIVMSLVGVNPDNGAAQLVAAGADTLVLRFRDLFLPADPRLGLVVNYGLAALFWLVVGLLAARVVRTVGRLV